MESIRKPKIEGVPAMKSIPEVLGSLQLLLPLDFDLQEVFESYLTKEHKGFLSLLRVVEPFVESFP
jgi:hypothetical protein